MAYELFYTSAPRGLRAANGGLCAVAETRGLPGPLAARLEQLGGHRPAATADAPDAGAPLLLAHYRLPLAGGTRSVLTRVDPAGLDHTGRPNVLAYHLSLDPAEQPAAGPVCAAARIARRQWEGEPRLLAPPPPLPAAPPPPPRPCGAWAAAAGDAGWGGVVAASAMDPAARPTYVILPAGADPLPLLAEAAALVPAALRWHVTFSTRFAGGAPPAGAECRWRCAAEGTPAAAEARARPASAGLVVDLARPMRPPVGPAADRGREGRPVDPPED